MESLIQTIIALSYIGIFAAVFAESGLLIGFFLPGDSLLFTAGLFAAKGDLNIVLLCLGCFIAAVAGDQVGYWVGARYGKRLYAKPDSLLFRAEHVEKTKDFYNKYGKMTLILARFTPIVRTFAPVMAGVADMDYRQFLTYNLIGGFLWGIGMPLLGYFAGSLIPDIDKYILPILVVIVVASVIPALKHLLPKNQKPKTK